MPLRQVREYGGECPLGKFKIDIPAGAGGYTSDPVEACSGNLEFGVPVCNFADVSSERFDLEKVCMCPSDMTWNDYDRLRKGYASTKGKKTSQDFWKYVKENFKSE